jgi:2-dehydropantoate 2-reductase
MKRIAVVGAGGIGAFLGGVLAERGHEVAALVRGRHGDELRINGLVLETRGARRRPQLRFVTELEELGEPELVLLCVKAYDLDAVAASLRSLPSSTTIFAMQSGLESLARTAEILGPERVVGGVAWHFHSHIVEPGVVKQTGRAARLVTSVVEGGDRARAEEIAKILTAAGIPSSTTDDYRAELWDKTCHAAPLSTVSCVLRASLGEIFAMAAARSLFVEATNEAIAVAAADGVVLDAAKISLRQRELAEANPGWKSSMLWDLERGRRLELDALSGAIVRAGQRLHVPTPTHAFICSALSTAEHARARPRS